jgi:hypothetical protein
VRGLFLSLLILVVIIVFLVSGKVAATKKADDCSYSEFPCVGAGVNDRFLLGIEIGLSADGNGGAAGEDCQGDDRGENKIEVHGTSPEGWAGDVTGALSDYIHH